MARPALVKTKLTMRRFDPSKPRVVCTELTFSFYYTVHIYIHGLRTPREVIAFTARPKIHSHSQIFRYGRSIFCLPHQPNFSDIFDLFLHWVSIVREKTHLLLAMNPTLKMRGCRESRYDNVICTAGWNGTYRVKFSLKLEF